jgi:threonine aldolase
MPAPRSDALTRRDFAHALGISAALLSSGRSATGAPGDATVQMTGDGIGLTPVEFAGLLQRLTSAREVVEDNYLLGGEIDAFEHHWAELLGKEMAVFMPSGTLANQLALRVLAGARRRVIVPEMSHIYNDTGDGCQTLSNLTLLPLAAGQATFTRADVESVLARTASGRVAADVGAIVIESPVRRLSGQMFEWSEAQRITSFARERRIATHLDGARLFIASAYTGLAPKDYASAFDTVYVSLWKYFNCGQGAILAGPKRVLEGMFHVRRMFGGNLAQGWAAALVARHYMEGYIDRLKAAVRVSEDLFAALGRHPRLTIERIPNGTNLTRWTLRGVEGRTVATRLAPDGIRFPNASTGVATIAVNETWARRSSGELVRAFEKALG